MTGLPNIPHTNQTLEERGIPSHSFFTLVLKDGSVVDERDTNWSAISEPVVVGHFEGQKMVHLCTLPVSLIRITHSGLSSELVVSEGQRVYQAIRGESVIHPGLDRHDKIAGRIVGLVVGNEIVEEHYLDGLMNEVVGARK